MQNVWRTPLMLVALFAIGFMIIFGYASATRVDPVDAAPGGRVEADSRPMAAADTAAAAAAQEPAQRSGPDVNDAAPAAQSEKSSPQTVPPETVAKWVADATGADTRKRPQAILALAGAPKADAVPVLRTLLTAGDPYADRPLALRSLRTLALEQGDADGVIRDVLRQAIYHADDEAMSLGAQEMLSDVEAGMSKAAPRANH